MRHIQIFQKLFIAVVLQLHLSGGSLQKVWEFDLRHAVQGSDKSGSIGPGVTAIRFSPDGKQIAVATGPRDIGGQAMSSLLVLDIANPAGSVRRFEIEGMASDLTLGVDLPGISWSPSSDLVLAAHDLIHVRTGKMCRSPSGFGYGGAFLGPDRTVAGIQLKFRALRFEVTDLDCRIVASWVVQGEWYIGDASPSGGLVSAMRKTSREPADPPEDLLVVDPVARKVIRTWPPAQTGLSSRFVDDGKVLCAGDRGGEPDLSKSTKVPPRCMDVDSGKIIAEAANINGGFPFAAADRGSRLVVSDYKDTWNFFFREYDTFLNRRAVWDFRKNIEIASWKPEKQSYRLLGTTTAKVPFVFAISPDGEYVAEGGNSVLRLYRVEP